MDESIRQTVLVCEDRAFRYLPVEDTEELLRILLNLYLKGLRKPLHLYSESSLIFAERMMDGKETEKALRAAMAKWDAYDFAENGDPYYQLCFRQIDPLDNEFCELAIKVFSPMLNHEEQIK
jgi:exonuclease V gamma subunit